MAAYLRLLQENKRVPQRKIRNCLNPVKFYDDCVFIKRYRFSKDYAIRITDQIRPAIEHGRNAARAPTTDRLN